MSTVRVKLLLPLVQVENGKLKSYEAGSIVEVTESQADHMLTRRRAELVSAPDTRNTDSIVEQPLRAKKKRGV